MATEIALRTNGTDLDVMQLGRVLAQSGYFKDAREAAQATVKVLAGREMGVGPVASMVGIHIIEGKPVISAGLMAAAVKGSAKYDYRVKEKSDTACSLEFFENGASVGVETFSIKDAQAAGLAGKPVWKSYPRNMLFARCLSNGVRFYCPDVFQVGSVYTPEELGAEVDQDGAIVPPELSETPEVAGKMTPAMLRARYDAVLPRLAELGIEYPPLEDGARFLQARFWVEGAEALVKDKVEELAAGGAATDEIPF